MPFHIYHIPALISTFTLMLGSPWSIVSPRTSLSEFGFLPAIAQSPAAQPVMVAASTRGAVLGALMAIFYARGQYEDVDLILMLLGGYAGITDSWVVYREGNKRFGVFRLSASWLIAAAGWAGLTAKGGR
jgi:hypothetical protein